STRAAPPPPSHLPGGTNVEGRNMGRRWRATVSIAVAVTGVAICSSVALAAVPTGNTNPAKNVGFCTGPVTIGLCNGGVGVNSSGQGNIGINNGSNVCVAGSGSNNIGIDNGNDIGCGNVGTGNGAGSGNNNIGINNGNVIGNGNIGNANGAGSGNN